MAIALACGNPTLDKQWMWRLYRKRDRNSEFEEFDGSALGYIHGNGALIVLQNLVSFRSDSCIQNSSVETVKARSALRECFHRGLMGQVKLPDINNTSTSALRLNLCFGGLSFGDRAYCSSVFLSQHCFFEMDKEPPNKFNEYGTIDTCLRTQIGGQIRKGPLRSLDIHDDFFGIKANWMFDSFFTKTDVRAGDDDGLAREIGGWVVRPMEELGC